MTRDEILNMEAGREMDAMIAEKVMCDPMGQVWSRHYSTDISAAWKVVEKMEETVHTISIERCIKEAPDWWFCIIIAEYDNDEKWCAGEANTAPLAICKAALLTVLEE